MADDINISYSFQTGSSAPIAPPAERLLAFADCDRVDLGNQLVLLLNRRNGKQTTMAPDVAAALSHCDTFMTLAQHAERLVNSIPQLNNQLANVTAVLKTVAASGIMLDAQAVCDQLGPGTAAAAELAPTRVFIVTCDRPAAVARLLDSMLEAGTLSRHDELFLVDDSRSPANGEQNRELVMNFNRGSGQSMRYVGATQQRKLLRQLIAALPEHEAPIRFLIDRERWAAQQSYGLSRTVCLLLSVGYRCIMLDDDILCSAVLPPAQSAGISFGRSSNRELACFASEQALMQAAIYSDTDPLSGHARCLGMNLGDALTELGCGGVEPAMLRETGAARFETLRASSPVLVTQCGTWGDPGTPNCNWFYALEPDSVSRLLAAPNGLRQAMENRYYWRGRKKPQISTMAVMSQMTGVDNSRLLPPYFPELRGEDVLFGGMVSYLHPDAAILDHAWSVPHLPVERRAGQGAGDPFASKGGINLCAHYLAGRAAEELPTCTELRVQKLALLLRELSECEAADLLALFRVELAREHANQLDILNEQLARAPEFGSQDWERFLRGGIEEVSAALRSPASPADIPGFPDNLSEQALLQQVQEVTGEFSAAIAAWPAMREAAATITAQLLDCGELAP